jgi:hypothetical protein
MPGVPGKTIVITILKPDGASEIANLLTDNYGSTVLAYTPTMIGNYMVSGSFVGTSSYPASHFNFTFNSATGSYPTILKYTVVGNGTTYTAYRTDNTVLATGAVAHTVINTAFNSLTSGRTMMERVVLTGTFILSSSIVIKSLSALDATGANISGTATFVYGSGLNNFEIVGGNWDGTNIPNGSGGRFMSLSGCSYGVLKDIRAHDIYYDGIEVTSSSHMTVYNIDVGKVGHTALVMATGTNQKSEYNVVEYSHFYDCALGGGCYFLCDTGFLNAQSNYNVIRRCTAERTYLSGLSLCSLRESSDSGTGSLAEYNTCIDCGLDHYHPGIACGWGGNPATNCIIQYNYIYETGTLTPPGSGGGIDVAMHSGTIFNNIIKDVTDYGIGIKGSYNIVSYNQVSGVITTTYPGISIGNGSYNEVTHNYVFGCPHATMIWPNTTTYPDVNGGHHNHFAYNHFANITYGHIYIHKNDNTQEQPIGTVFEYNTWTGTPGAWTLELNQGTQTVNQNNTSGSSPVTRTGSDIIVPIDTKYIVYSSGSTYYAIDRYGVLLNSGTSAHTVINAAINSLTYGRTTQERVFLHGTFYLTRPITPTNYSIVDAYTSSMIAIGTSGYYMFDAESVNDVSLIGGVWNTNKDGRTWDGWAAYPIFFHNCIRVYCSDLTTYNSGNSGLKILGCNNIVATRLHVHHAVGGLLGFEESTNGLCEDCYVHDGFNGIYVFAPGEVEEDATAQNISNWTIRRNRVERVTNSGIEAPSLRGLVPPDYGANFLIEYNTCVDCGLDGNHAGICSGWAAGGDDPTAIRYGYNCIVQYNTIYGSFVQSETGTHLGGGILCLAHNSTVRYNTIYDIWDAGIYVRGNDDIIYTNNVTRCGMGWYCGIVAHTALRAEITYNTVTACKTGIQIYSGCISDHVAYNQILNNTVYGIRVMGAETDPPQEAAANLTNIEYNTLSGNTKHICNQGTNTTISNNTGSNTSTC